MGNDVGLEIFEFIKPKYHGSKNLFDKESWTRGGYFHIAITAVDPAQLATSIVEKGGKQVGPLCSLPNGQKAVYVKDPWGNVVEIASCDFAKLVSP